MSEIKIGDIFLVNDRAWGDLGEYKGKLCRVESEQSGTKFYQVSILGKDREWTCAAESFEFDPIPEQLINEPIETILFYYNL